MTDQQYHPCTPITRRKGRKSWGLGGRETLAVLLPQLPGPQEISHTLKYDRLKLPTTFFTDKYGQVQIQTDIYEQQVYFKVRIVKVSKWAVHGNISSAPDSATLYFSESISRSLHSVSGPQETYSKRG